MIRIIGYLNDLFSIPQIYRKQIINEARDALKEIRDRYTKAAIKAGWEKHPEKGWRLKK